MPRPRKQPELVLIPASLDHPLFRKEWEAYWDWRINDARHSDRKLAVKDADGMKRDWLALCEDLGLAAAIAALRHTKANRYKGLFPAPHAIVKSIETQLKPQQSNAAFQPSERWLDALKLTLKEHPEYAENGMDYDAAVALGFDRIPHSLRADIFTTAKQFGLKL